ncbi:MAG: anthranilate phosphoribosyltransferase [Deltaproteobacteria bacterium]|nr:anthranilate phosphoribosyltransferase [Deltaproteobacteria bacterium]
MIREAIARALRGDALSVDEAATVASEVAAGGATPAQIGAWLVALRAKGETVDEILGVARAFRAVATRVPGEFAGAIDTCGTGGDGAQSFNVSTAAGIVAAAAGAVVAKHGNRAVSSRSGSADVLEAAGVRITAAPAVAASSLALNRFAFLYAPAYHPAMKHAAPVRREIGVRTVFNLVGPLVNPVPLSGQLLGVFDEALVGPLAAVLRGQGLKRAMVVHGRDGLDELSVVTTTLVAELKPSGEISTYDVSPEDVGIARHASGDALRTRDANESVARMRACFEGEPGIVRDAVLVNAGAALYVAGCAGSVRDGSQLAVQAIDGGAARATLESVVRTYAKDDGRTL